MDGNKLLKLDQLKGAFGETTFCFTFCFPLRDNAGNAKDFNNKYLLQEIQRNVKNLAKQSAFADIADILSSFNCKLYNPQIKEAYCKMWYTTGSSSD